MVAKYLIYKIYFLIAIYNVWHANITGSLLNLIMYGFMVCNYDGRLLLFDLNLIASLNI